MILLCLILCFLAACASSEKTAVSKSHEDTVLQNSEKTALKDSDYIMIPRELFDSASYAWAFQWKQNYNRDTSLYQGITSCMYPDYVGYDDNEVVTVAPLVENVVATRTEGFSIDGKTHIIYNFSPLDFLSPLDSLIKKTDGVIHFFPMSFSFVFSGDSLLGVRPQWDYNTQSTSDYKNSLNKCATKFGVKTLDEISRRQLYRQQTEKFEDAIRNKH